MAAPTLPETGASRTVQVLASLHTAAAAVPVTARAHLDCERQQHGQQLLLLLQPLDASPGGRPHIAKHTAPGLQ